MEPYMTSDDKAAHLVHHGDARNVVQAGNVSGDITVMTGRMSKRARLSVLGAVVAVGAAATLYVILRPEDRDSISVVAQVSMGSCRGGWVVPEDTQSVPLPADGDIRPAGAVQADQGIVTMTVQGDQEKVVVLQGLRVEIVSRRPALRGVLLPTPCEGDLTPRTFGIDLAKPAPAAVGLPGKRGGEEIPAPRFPFRVSDTDPEQLEITPTSATEDVEWRLRLVWTSGDQRGEAVVDDNGRPFRTTATSAVTRRFCVDWNQAAWAPPSPTNPCQQPTPTTSFAGQWHQHAGTLSIAGDGTVTMAYQRGGADGLPLFPEVTLRIVSTTDASADAEVLTSTDPAAPVGSRFHLIRTAIGLDVVDPAENLAHWCDTEHAKQGVCGA
jgi:hypothetical protein